MGATPSIIVTTKSVLHSDYVQSEFPVRLRGGTSPSEGRIEVLYNGVWGTVCDDSWDINDATVVCHELGYRVATRATTNGEFGSGHADQPIWLDEVACSGSEAHIADCVNGGWGTHDCHHYEDAGVSCEGTGLYVCIVWYVTVCVCTVWYMCVVWTVCVYCVVCDRVWYVCVVWTVW